jgi:hypothetical protein
MTTASIPSTVPFITSLRAFHGDPAIKATYLARVHAHAAADEIVQGKYWEGGKGCAVPSLARRRSLWAIQASDKLVEILASAPVPVLARGVE